jgi:hypothetical protein
MLYLTLALSAHLDMSFTAGLYTDWNGKTVFRHGNESFKIIGRVTAVNDFITQELIDNGPVLVEGFVA